MKIRIAALIALMAGVCSAPTFAQQAPPAAEKLAFRKWDFGGSVGILTASRREFGGSRTSGGYPRTNWAWNLDAGRYFTQHLKAEAGLLKTEERYAYGSSYSSTLTGTNTFTSRRFNPTSVSGAMTYQFFENVFAHPYVSAGIRVSSIHEESQTTSYTYIPGTISSSTHSESTRSFTEVRPFVAAGYKSYFNERAYMRSEVLFAIDNRGVSHGTLRLGFGIDF